MARNNTLKEGFQIIILILLIFAIFPILAAKLFEAVLTGIIVGVVLAMIILAVWFFLNRQRNFF